MLVLPVMFSPCECISIFCIAFHNIYDVYWSCLAFCCGHINLLVFMVTFFKTKKKPLNLEIHCMVAYHDVLCIMYFYYVLCASCNCTTFASARSVKVDGQKYQTKPNQVACDMY